MGLSSWDMTNRPVMLSNSEWVKPWRLYIIAKQKAALLYSGVSYQSSKADDLVIRVLDNNTVDLDRSCNSRELLTEGHKQPFR